jgi:hypothetical protein
MLEQEQTQKARLIGYALGAVVLVAMLLLKLIAR